MLLLGAGGIATALTLFRVAKAVDFLNSDDITVDYTPIGILTYVVRPGNACLTIAGRSRSLLASSAPVFHP